MICQRRPGRFVALAGLRGCSFLPTENISTQRMFPDMLCMKKALHRQKGVGKLVSSQERRALLVPLINRLSTAGFVPPSVYIEFPLFVLQRHTREDILPSSGTKSNLCCPSATCAARPRPAPPSRHAPPRTVPPGLCPGFGFGSGCNLGTSGSRPGQFLESMTGLDTWSSHQLFHDPAVNWSRYAPPMGYKRKCAFCLSHHQIN